MLAFGPEALPLPNPERRAAFQLWGLFSPSSTWLAGLQHGVGGDGLTGLLKPCHGLSRRILALSQEGNENQPLLVLLVLLLLAPVVLCKFTETMLSASILSLTWPALGLIDQAPAAFHPGGRCCPRPFRQPLMKKSRAHGSSFDYRSKHP